MTTTLNAITDRPVSMRLTYGYRQEEFRLLGPMTQREIIEDAHAAAIILDGKRTAALATAAR